MSRERIPSISPTESLILDLLVAREKFGLELVGTSGGRLKRGSIYVTLGRMELKGFVESRQEDRAPGAIGLPRRLYRKRAPKLSAAHTCGQSLFQKIERAGD